jgi:hypothetical protein
MSSTATSFAAPEVSPKERLDVLFEEFAELAGQRNAIDGRIVEIIAEIDRDGLAGMTGAKSIPALAAWKLGVSPRNADIFTTIAQRRAEFPRGTAMVRQGRVSLDQMGVIAERAANGSDEHYAQLIPYATVEQLRHAVNLESKPTPTLEPQPEPEPEYQPEPWESQPAPWELTAGSTSEPPPEPPPEPGPGPESRPEPPRRQPKRSITHTSDDQSVTWHITLPHHEAAEFQAALDSHRDALVADWKRDHATGTSNTTPPFPTPVDGFMSLVHAGWDADVAARPHGHRTTVVVHLDVKTRAAALHLGPLLSDDDRRYLLCDATCEVWFERDGHPLGAGRESRTLSRRLRRALEHRDRGTCVVPGCGATRGLHAHHLIHWEDGGPTEPSNLVLVCPFHHRAHHRGRITLTGPAHQLVVTDAAGRQLTNASLARPPTTQPPNVPPCPGPTGERAQWWWYTPFQPPAAS